MLRYGTVRTRRGNDIAFAAIGPDAVDGGAPVFLVHPINMRKESWLGIVPSLARDRLCVAVDLAGHGESGDDEEFTLEGWASDCAEVAGSLGLDRFHLVGGSLGGTIALCLAGELPSKVLSVTAMGSSIGGEPDTAGELDPAGAQGSDVTEMLASGTVEDLFAILAVEAVAPGSPASLVTTVRRLTNTHGAPIVRRILRAAQTADATARVPDVRCPVLVLTGEFDTTCTPRMGRRMAENVGGRHHLLSDVGHLPMLEDAAAVLRLLLPHLEAAEPPPAERAHA
ncbi:alpha/beta hydrolase [Nonomuraea sp. NPDC048916]|uniref:alpha/beta fold hydrolase n=1 Tax=Nonomuraea sp. NPDC048916 TaxID=3154232 RepID=UPI0033E147B4